MLAHQQQSHHRPSDAAAAATAEQQFQYPVAGGHTSLNTFGSGSGLSPARSGYVAPPWASSPPPMPTPTPTPTPSQQAATPTKAASATPQKAAGLPSQLPTSPKQPSTPQNDGMAKLAMLRRKKPAKPAGAPQSPAPASPAPAAPAPAAAAAPVPAAPAAAAAAPAQQSPAPAAAPPVAAWRSPKPEPPTERKYLDGALKEEVIVPERATAALTGGLKVNSFDRARQIADGMDEDDGSDDGDFAPIKIG
eukprot:Rhum_TRINITY_DN14246_c9_g1::Rhum_TRINITY_DN14246_c9_g1_i2::g.75749::m.75749